MKQKKKISQNYFKYLVIVLLLIASTSYAGMDFTSLGSSPIKTTIEKYIETVETDPSIEKLEKLEIGLMKKLDDMPTTSEIRLKVEHKVYQQIMILNAFIRYRKGLSMIDSQIQKIKDNWNEISSSPVGSTVYARSEVIR